MKRPYPTHEGSFEGIVGEAETALGTRVEYELYLDDPLLWLERAEENSAHLGYHPWTE